MTPDATIQFHRRRIAWMLERFNGGHLPRHKLKRELRGVCRPPAGFPEFAMARWQAEVVEYADREAALAPGKLQECWCALGEVSCPRHRPGASP